MTPGSRSDVIVRSFVVDILDSRARLMAAIMLCGALLSIVLLTAVRTRVRAAMPFALIYGSVGALVAAAVAGWMEAAVHPIA
ncbi:MAG: hypothetical protein GY723_11845, partial [bacterium]|nr:hypothetical protein [bacterium]